MMARNSMDLFSLLLTSHNYYFGVIPSILATHHGRQTPQPSPCAKHSRLFPPIHASLPTPVGWWRRPSSSPSSLARSSCRRAVVVLVVMLVVVLLLSVVPSCRCCHRRRCHRRPTNAQRPSPSPRPPPSPLPSQSHSLQLSPQPLPCCRFHRRRRRHSHCPRQPHRHTNYLNADIAGCRHRCGHRRCRCRCHCIRCSHCCRHRPHLRCHHRRSLY